MTRNPISGRPLALAFSLAFAFSFTMPFDWETISGSQTVWAAPARRRPTKRKKAPAPEPFRSPDPAPGRDDAPPDGALVGEVSAPAPVPEHRIESNDGANVRTSDDPARAVETPPVETPAGNAGAAAQEKPDLARLRARYDELRDAIFRSRARRETLEDALFSTKVTASLHWQANRHYRLARAEVRLDGARLWESGERPVGDEPILLADKSVAPGAHVLSVRIDVRARDNPDLGYSAEQSFALALREGKHTRVKIKIDEDGRLPSYNPDIHIDVND